ncbi:hypothetical protein BpHYR1_039781 [Brachionus plicatilis]|uniref:Uncharacterized protein n=1 Tax=Brachionus plicatilis TaxID=10195 RepID=A0A3M7Q6F5_BRAPC|nr:hypothetical protein BpHYR1_039781 [Brachionus plicatilis]
MNLDVEIVQNLKDSEAELLICDFFANQFESNSIVLLTFPSNQIDSVQNRTVLFETKSSFESKILAVSKSCDAYESIKLVDDVNFFKYKRPAYIQNPLIFSEIRKGVLIFVQNIFIQPFGHLQQYAIELQQ